MGKRVWCQFFLCWMWLFDLCGESSKWDLEASWLYLRAAEDLTIGKFVYFGVSTEETNARIKPRFASGLRGSIHILPACSDLDMTVYYSYYRSHATQRWNGLSTPDPFQPSHNIGNVLHSLKNEIQVVPPATMITILNGFHTLRIQDCGVDFAYPIDYEGCFLFKPFIGLKGLMIEQELHYGNSFIRLDTRTTLNQYEAHHQVARFNSFGLEGGFYCHCAVREGFFLFSNLGLALLYGQKSLDNQSEVTLLEGISNHDSTLTFSKRYDTISPCFKSAFGIFYKYKMVMCKLSWENCIYANQNSFNAGDLSTYGGVFSLAWVF